MTVPYSWAVYMVRCADGTIYTGVTTDVVRRTREHNRGSRGAKYTRSRRPVVLVHYEGADSRSAACKVECLIKKLSRADKEALIEKRGSP